MKVAFLTRSLVGGGAERQLLILARSLARRGHQICILSFYDPDGGADGVRVIGLRKGGRWDVLAFMWRLISAVRREAPDILHGYLPVANVLAALVELLMPRALVVFGVRASRMELAAYDWLSTIAYRLERWLARRADLIICNSHAALRTAQEAGFPLARLCAIHNGIDTDHFRPDREAGTRLRAELGLAADDRLIGMVGRIDPMKDHATFLTAFARLARARPDLRALIVGDGPDILRKSLLTASRDLGIADRLVWTGRRGDVTRAYPALDVLCLSSAFGESFPNVVGEAMACGVPCVATDLGDVRLVVGDGGNVVPPRDPQALADALAAVIDDSSLRAALGRRARAHIAAEFSLARMVDRTEAALARLLSH